MKRLPTEKLLRPSITDLLQCYSTEMSEPAPHTLQHLVVRDATGDPLECRQYVFFFLKVLLSCHQRRKETTEGRCTIAQSHHLTDHFHMYECLSLYQSSKINKSKHILFYFVTKKGVRLTRIIVFPLQNEPYRRWLLSRQCQWQYIAEYIVTSVDQILYLPHFSCTNYYC